MNELKPLQAAASSQAGRSFAALRHPGFRAQFSTSPALGGFAVVSHWVPYLLFSVASGALADRFDPRRVIQCGMALFIIASLSWSYFFVTDSLQMWQAMAILVVHGCAGVLWQTPNQMLLYDIVGPQDLESAVRLNAMARYLAVLVGPAVGGAILIALGPAHGIMLNTVFYLPLVLWLINAPYGPRYRAGTPPPRRAVLGLNDIIETTRDIRGHSTIVSMVLLAGASSFFVGNAYSSQMPGFAADLHHGDPGLSYSLLLAADAAGGLLAGLVLEGGGWLAPRPRTAIVLALMWCAALTVFSLANVYWLAVAFLFAAGFLELSFNAMAQSLVQLNAPLDKRGRIIGLFNMASLGLRAFSGVSVGLIGSFIGVHWSLALSAMAAMLVAAGLLVLP
jgi:MFS family permease